MHSRNQGIIEKDKPEKTNNNFHCQDERTLSATDDPDVQCKF